MFVIGLTGPTGAGKSTFSSMLRERGFYIADADAAARKIVQPGSGVLDALCETFGADILEKDGTLCRKTLAKRAFSSPENVQKLNALTHPAIERVLFGEIAAHPDARGAVIDAPALIESGISEKCDLVAVVLAPPEERLRRILLRDAMTEEQAKLRMQAQPPDAFYLDKADVVLRGFAPYDPQAELDKLLERVPL